MRSKVGVCATALWLLFACGEDDSTSAVGPGGNGDAGQQDGGADAGADGGATAWDGSAPLPSQPDADIDDPNGQADAGPDLMLDIPKALVPCGDTECDTLDKVCCEGWSQNQGFMGTPTCVKRDECNRMHVRYGTSNRVVAHECDGKEDCSGGQVCCFYGDGMPMCDISDWTMCKPLGPGGSRICTDDDKCQTNVEKFVVEGIPFGVLSCNEDGDCSTRPGTTCQPEESNSLSTGMNTPARSYVKVCR